jgi:hypothetical protein
MTLDEAMLVAIDHATRFRHRCYVVCLAGDHLPCTRDEIESRGLAMAQSPSPVVGYYDPSAITLGDFKAQ